jgi:hypothetical protein
MSRRLLCAGCGDERREGLRVALAASELGEPAEWERIVKGRAHAPTTEQRTMFVNGEPLHLAMDGYDCDRCGGAIKPGDEACAETIWLDGRPEPPAWESEFLASPASPAPSSATPSPQGGRPITWETRA